MFYSFVPLQNFWGAPRIRQHHGNKGSLGALYNILPGQTWTLESQLQPTEQKER